jgi:hypothetical protein
MISLRNILSLHAVMGERTEFNILRHLIKIPRSNFLFNLPHKSYIFLEIYENMFEHFLREKFHKKLLDEIINFRTENYIFPGTEDKIQRFIASFRLIARWKNVSRQILIEEMSEIFILSACFYCLA